ncbi:SRPBCC domain-containing protein [Rhodococcus sp. NPDC127530]|uniref:SRPBCC family protein n=1 Tax=unclassified Rhodococcus (in: high G+C Gram-positive bacteria) TaxID=192944 RepID=UPI00362E0865
MTESQPVIEVSVAAAPSVVWSALRDPELIRRWHGWDYAGLADEIREIYFDDVTEDAAAFTLALNGADRFSLHEHEGTTLVRITRPPRSGDPAADDWYDDVTEGWTTFLQFLKFGIERHALDERRTLFLEGPVADGDSARHLLGLDKLEGMTVGDHFTVVAETGDLLHGVVCFVGEHQTAVSVDDLGPGLLQFGEQPVNAARPNGGAQILLAAYDLDDEEWAELEERWTQWWQARPGAEPAT